jgi:hypothetical protein
MTLKTEESETKRRLNQQNLPEAAMDLKRQIESLLEIACNCTMRRRMVNFREWVS